MFDAVVGNPPYQRTASKNGHDIPVYQYFYELAENMGHLYTLITPARFLTDSGYTPTVWNNYMLNNPHIKLLTYIEDAKSAFQTASIEGGVVSLYYSAHSTIGPIGIFTKDTSTKSILDKVHLCPTFTSIQGGMYGTSKVDLERVYRDYPEIKQARPKANINDSRFASDAFTIFAPLFTSAPDNQHTIGIYGRLPKLGRVMRYVDPSYLVSDDTTTPLDKYKVVIASAYGGGNRHGKISKPEVLSVDEGHTMSFRTLGVFDTKLEADNLVKYVQTKLFRLLLGVAKSTQHMPPKVFRYVPVQDFSNQSDIDWSLTISEIDKQLYAKYNLTSEEIEYIENNIQSME